ncbi:MAG TPA: hypothetical protein VHE30_21920 [Polyangiaceae bacterium]|nr:hypothetical protein [Polyangiaceae bacterium]
MKVAEGDDLLRAIAELPGPADTFVAAVGTLEAVELSFVRGGAEDTLRVPGRVTLVSLSGPKSGPIHVVVVRGDGAGQALHAGKVVRARSLGVVLSVVGRPTSGEAPSEAGAEEAVRAVPPAAKSAPPAATAPTGWAALAEIKPEEDPDEESDELPKYGDRVQHGVFGLCDVMVVRGDRMKIRDVHGTGRMREVHVGAFKILRPIVRDGKRVFRLAKKD